MSLARDAVRCCNGSAHFTQGACRMRRTLQAVLCGLCLAAVTAPAAAVVGSRETEEFGPAPKLEQKPSDQRLALSHLPGRVYRLHSTWSGFGHNRDDGVVAYQGDAGA